MSDVALLASRPGGARRVAIGAAVVLGWLVGTWLVGAVFVFLFPLVLIAAVVLVPTGFVYGVVVRSVLVGRRRRARLQVGGGPVADARFGVAVQRNDRWLAIVLLVAALLAGAFWILASVLDAQGYVSNDTTTAGDLYLASGAFAAGLVVEVIAAIPIAAVNVTRQAIDIGALAGEAGVLAGGGGAARRIRVTRALSWVAYGVYSVVAVGVAISFAQSLLR
jgi:hypothetical protein